MTEIERLKAERVEAVNRLQAWLDAEDISLFGQHEKDIETLIDAAAAFAAADAAYRAALAAQAKEKNDD